MKKTAGLICTVSILLGTQIYAQSFEDKLPITPLDNIENNLIKLCKTKKVRTLTEVYHEEGKDVLWSTTKFNKDGKLVSVHTAMDIN